MASRPACARPPEAIAAGVGMLHQDPLDFPPLTVLDDFLLGRAVRAAALSGHGGRHGASWLSLGSQFGFQSGPGCAGLLADRRRAPAARDPPPALAGRAGPDPGRADHRHQRGTEGEPLCRAARGWRPRARRIIFVSHKLEDVQELCDTVTVLRQGKVAGRCELPCSNDRLVEIMFGQVLARSPAARTIALGDVRPGAAGPLGRRRPRPGDRPGPARAPRRGDRPGGPGGQRPGSGAARLRRPAQAVGGAASASTRSDLTGQPYRRFLEAGVAFLPAGRLEEGLVPGLDLCEHVVLATARRCAD